MRLLLKAGDARGDMGDAEILWDERRPRLLALPERKRPLPLEWLPPRERQIAGIVAARTHASAVDICDALGGTISNAAVRSMLRRLELKGVLRRRRQGRKYLYILACTAPDAGLQALRELVDSHFGGSPMEAALTLLGMLPARDDEQAEAITRLSVLLKEVDLD